MGVLSLDAAFKAIPEIPEGALLVVVRQNNPYNPVWITHLGFVVRHSKTMYGSDTQPKWVVVSSKSIISNGILSTFGSVLITDGRRFGVNAARTNEKTTLNLHWIRLFGYIPFSTNQNPIVGPPKHQLER